MLADLGRRKKNKKRSPEKIFSQEFMVNPAQVWDWSHAEILQWLSPGKNPQASCNVYQHFPMVFLKSGVVIARGFSCLHLSINVGYISHQKPQIRLRLHKNNCLESSCFLKVCCVATLKKLRERAGHDRGSRQLFPRYLSPLVDW